MSSGKTRVAVLYGGKSGEHEISLVSAASVLKNLDTELFEPIPVGITKEGKWLVNDTAMLTQMTNGDNKLPITCPGAKEITPLSPQTSPQTLANWDVVFPVLHGPLYEDGTIQGLFELSDIPYVGANVLSSAISMDKVISKQLLAAAGVEMGPFTSIRFKEWQKNPSAFQTEIEDTFGYPVFIKPANLGSSVGIHKVHNRQELTTALADAFHYDMKVIVEKALDVREIELAVLEHAEFGAPPLVSIPGEVIPHHDFYSYEAKYLDDGGATLSVPADLTSEQRQQVQTIAEKIFETLDCEGMARIDLFLEKESGRFLFNEVNTIPGFTAISMYPRLWEASGIAYDALLTHLIQLAKSRHAHKRMIHREWAGSDN